MNEMNKTNIFSTIVFVLIAAMNIGLALSCKDDKEPEQEISIDPIINKWYYKIHPEGVGPDTRYYLEFRKNNSYTYVTEKENIEGMYRITESGKTTFIYTYLGVSPDGAPVEELMTFDDAILYKMLVSGGKDYDQLWVYSFKMDPRSEYYSIDIHFYSGNTLVYKFRD